MHLHQFQYLYFRITLVKRVPHTTCVIACSTSSSICNDYHLLSRDCFRIYSPCALAQLTEKNLDSLNGPLTRYVKLRVAHAPGMPGTFTPQPRVSDPYMHHGTCVTHVPWCMSGSFTSGFVWSQWWGNVPGISSACATRHSTYLVRGPWTSEKGRFTDKQSDSRSELTADARPHSPWRARLYNIS